LRQCAYRHKKRTLLSSVFWKKELKEEDLSRVFEHPEGISKRLLEGRIARKASKSSICRRKEEGFISLEI
jgi:hypothetical protein